MTITIKTNAGAYDIGLEHVTSINPHPNKDGKLELSFRIEKTITVSKKTAIELLPEIGDDKDIGLVTSHRLVPLTEVELSAVA